METAFDAEKRCPFAASICRSFVQSYSDDVSHTHFRSTSIEPLEFDTGRVGSGRVGSQNFPSSVGRVESGPCQKHPINIQFTHKKQIIRRL